MVTETVGRAAAYVLWNSTQKMGFRCLLNVSSPNLRGGNRASVNMAGLHGFCESAELCVIVL